MAIRTIEFNKNKQGQAIVLLGTFDGMHLGHKALFQRAKELALQKDGYTIMYTFSNNPRQILDPEVDYCSLMTLDEKIEGAHANGLDAIALEEFDAELASVTPEQFVQRLITLFDVKDIVVGYNYTFGTKAQGDCATLLRLTEHTGIRVHIVLPVEVERQTVSSSLIRKLLTDGEIEKANRLLSYHYSVGGKVVGGMRIGRVLGYPTANLAYDASKLLPKNGVYATLCQVDNRQYFSICNVGLAPTIRSDKRITVECYLLNYIGDMYDEAISISFIKRIRDERAFKTPEQLSERIKTDIELAKAYLSIYAKTGGDSDY